MICLTGTRCRRRFLTYIENEWHIVKVELVLFFVVLLQLRGVVVLTLLCYMRSHMSLLFGLQPHIPHAGEPAAFSATSASWIIINSRLGYLFNIRLGGVDILIRLLGVLGCTLRFPPFSFKSLFTLRCRNKMKGREPTFSSPSSVSLSSE